MPVADDMGWPLCTGGPAHGLRWLSCQPMARNTRGSKLLRRAASIVDATNDIFVDACAAAQAIVTVDKLTITATNRRSATIAVLPLQSMVLTLLSKTWSPAMAWRGRPPGGNGHIGQGWLVISLETLFQSDPQHERGRLRARRETKRGERRLHPPIGGHLKPMWRGYVPTWTAVGLLPRGRDSTTTLVPMSAR